MNLLHRSRGSRRRAADLPTRHRAHGRLLHGPVRQAKCHWGCRELGGRSGDAANWPDGRGMPQVGQGEGCRKLGRGRDAANWAGERARHAASWADGREIPRTEPAGGRDKPQVGQTGGRGMPRAGGRSLSIRAGREWRALEAGGSTIQGSHGPSGATDCGGAIAAGAQSPRHLEPGWAFLQEGLYALRVIGTGY